MARHDRLGTNAKGKTQQRGALRFAGEYTVAVRNPAQMEGRLDGYVDKARPRVTTVQIVPARRPVSPTRLIDVSDYLPAGFPAGGLDWATVREPKNNSTPFSRHLCVQTDRLPRRAQGSHIRNPHQKGVSFAGRAGECDPGCPVRPGGCSRIQCSCRRTLFLQWRHYCARHAGCALSAGQMVHQRTTGYSCKHKGCGCRHSSYVAVLLRGPAEHGAWVQVECLGAGQELHRQVRKRRFLRHFILKTIILPRQARDKHRENSQKELRRQHLLRDQLRDDRRRGGLYLVIITSTVGAAQSNRLRDALLSHSHPRREHDWLSHVARPRPRVGIPWRRDR